MLGVGVNRRFVDLPGCVTLVHLKMRRAELTLRVTSAVLNIVSADPRRSVVRVL